MFNFSTDILTAIIIISNICILMLLLITYLCIVSISYAWYMWLCTPHTQSINMFIFFINIKLVSKILGCNNFICLLFFWIFLQHKIECYKIICYFLCIFCRHKIIRSWNIFFFLRHVNGYRLCNKENQWMCKKMSLNVKFNKPFPMK